MAEHVRVNFRPQAVDPGQAMQAPGCRMPVHSRAAAVEQDRPAVPAAGSPVDSSPDCGWQRDLHHFAALAAHAQHAVAVFFTLVGDVGASSFEDPQAKQAEHGHQREVARVR